MGLLVDGVWQEDVTRTTNGRFVRTNTAYHNFVTPDGSPGPNGKGGFPAEAGRYHLYISLACPWAHRTLIFRSLKQLDNVISVSLAEPLYGKTGWEFGTALGGMTDDVNHKATLAEIYLIQSLAGLGGDYRAGSRELLRLGRLKLCKITSAGMRTRRETLGRVERCALCYPG